MPSHPDRVRTAPLPAEYQFGDARHHGRIAIRFVQQWNITTDLDPKDLRAWRRPSDNAAEQLARRGSWNVIEGEHHESDHQESTT